MEVESTALRPVEIALACSANCSRNRPCLRFGSNLSVTPTPANAQVRWHDGLLLVKLADTLEGAPEDVLQALAEILLSKLFRRPVPPASNDRYRRYLNRRDVRRSLDLVRQIRGPKAGGTSPGPLLRPAKDVR